MSAGLDYATELITQARAARGMSLEALAKESSISLRTLASFGQVTPQRATLEKLETCFGWKPGILKRIVDSSTPWTVATISDMVGELPEAKITDEALMWELSQRFQDKDARITELEQRVSELESEIATLREE